MSNTYENAYVGVDPATVWQSPPINTPAEVEFYKAQGMLPVDSLGNVVEETAPVEETSETEPVETEGDGDNKDAETEGDAETEPVEIEGDAETDETITQPLL